MPLPQTKNLYNTFEANVYSKSTYIGIVEVLEYICFILIVYWFNPFSISTKYPVFSNVLTLLVSLIYVVLFYFLSEKISLNNVLLSHPTEKGFLAKLLGTLAFFIGSVIIIKYISGFIANGRLGILTLMRYIITFTIIIVAIAGIYTVFKKYIDIAKSRGNDGKSIMKFLLNLIMYLPCLLLNFIDYFKNQYNITTKPIWLLLLFELCLIVLWICVPLTLHAFATKNGLQLLKEPVHINKELTLGTFAELYDDKSTEEHPGDNTVKKFNYHYSISCWFYLNPQPPNTSPAYNKFTNILTYGGKPAIEYNGVLNTLRVSVASVPPKEAEKNVEIYKTTQVLYQKWNNIVINYDHGSLDVFLNGELVGSRSSIAPYMTYESIQVGSDDGLSGGICNVMYYNENLSRDKIELMYQTLRGQEEPFM